MNYGLNDSLKYTEFEFDSNDCTKSFNPAYSIKDWPDFYLGKPLENVAAIKVLEVQVPFSFYLINSTNNYFTLMEGSHSIQIILSPGNYSNNILTSTLANLLTTASPGSLTYQVAFNEIQNVLVIGNSSIVSGQTFSLNFNSKLANILGFNTGVITSTPSSGTAYSSIIIAPYFLQLSGPDYIYLNSRTLGPLIKLYLPGNGILNPVGTGADGPQICKLPLGSPGTVNVWKDPAPLFWFDLENSLLTGTMDFYFTAGTSNDPLQFNGCGFSFKMGILTNTSNHNSWIGGGKQNDRAVIRQQPKVDVSLRKRKK